MQACLLSHSELLMHSGLQAGGEPMKSGRQEQEGESLMTWHWELGPQGEGRHRSIGVGGLSAVIKIRKFKGQIALIFDRILRNLTWPYTLDERIASESQSATTDRVVIDHTALRLPSASSQTGISTLLVIAGFVERTL